MVGTGRFFRDSSWQSTSPNTLGISRDTRLIRNCEREYTDSSCENYYIFLLLSQSLCPRFPGVASFRNGDPERAPNSRHYSHVETLLAPRRPRHPPTLWTEVCKVCRFLWVETCTHKIVSLLTRKPKTRFTVNKKAQNPNPNPNPSVCLVSLLTRKPKTRASRVRRFPSYRSHSS